MDGDDEPAMTYFLPNGIADDSPPKKSRMKASFGSIGGRSATATTKQSTSTAIGSAAVVSAAIGASDSRSDVDCSGLHTRPRPTLDVSPFSSNRGSTSPPRATNFLLSDLGGEIHTPRDFGGSGGSTPTASRPFGFPGAFGPGLSDGGATGGAGAIGSPTSMFDKGQDVAKSFSMQGESRRSITTTGSYAEDASQLYRGGASNLSSYLNTTDADSPFGSSSMRTWTSSDVSQPRRVLQRPPGLAGPPGLGESNPMDGVQPRMRFGGGGDMMQQRVAAPQFGPFHPSTPMTARGPNGAFSSGDDQYGTSLLSSLRLSTGVFGDSSLNDQTDGRVLPNPDLAELNTHSVKIGEMDATRVRQAVDSSSMHWDREPTTSRRIDIQARSKTPRSPKKARDGRRKSEGRSDLRAKALEFSMDAINALTPSSPMRPRRADRGRKMTSPESAQESSPSSYDSSRNSGDLSAPRGKRRNQAADKGAASATGGGNDNRKRGTTSQNDEPGASLAPPPGLDSGESPVKLTLRESNKSRRREDTKPSSRSTSRRNSTRGNDKGASTTRRQVYREKQVKDNTKEAPPSEETAPIVTSPSTTSKPPQESQVSSDGQKSEVGANESKQDPTLAAESIVSSTKAEHSPEAATSTKTDSEIVAEVADTPPMQTDNKHGAIKVDDPNNPVTDETAVATNTSHETTQDERATSTERESSSSSDVPEDALGLVDEPSESHHGSRANVFDSEEMLSPIERFESDPGRDRASTGRQLAVPSKKSKRKSAVPTPATADISPPELEPLQAPTVEKKHAAKEPRREKSKKDKGDKKKMARSKKDKRGSSLLSKVADALNEPATETQDKMLEALVAHTTPLSVRISQGLRKGSSAAASAGLAAFLGARRGCIWAAGRLNIKGILTTIFSYVESVLAVVFSVVLLLSLHAASWFIRIHRVAFRAILTHRHIGFCFAFLYGFPFLVQYVFPWAPPWAPVCLWYAFLVQLFCTNGPTAMVTTFRVILPLVFLVEGISHHSFLLDLNGAELLLTSFIISALKTSNLCSPIFFLSLATQCLLAVFLGSELVVQWLQLALALYSLHVMATTDDEWLGIGDEEDELACHPVSMHHSIADYNHHPAPSSAVSIQKTKRLDRRALAYVRGRKLR
ncbi:uncharacterized protein KRP23_5423 [Phytophthora ramorum]|uniref:uncharacterized protein n=1 Tax=Phytophthora ramorum TaxID=164328 RepID=UPI0030A821B0|nr:hypothetical protein KRP23_5423 [Phytophthora ramorum]